MDPVDHAPGHDARMDLDVMHDDDFAIDDGPLGVNFILPGRHLSPIEYFRTALAFLFAHSYNFNVHNVEYYWYGYWAKIFTDLSSLMLGDAFDSFPRTGLFQVFPQFIVIEPDIPRPRPILINVDNPDTSGSSVMTAPMRTSLKRLIADFALVHLRGSHSVPAPPLGINWNPEYSTSFDLAHGGVPLIGEAKRWVSRRSREAALLVVDVHKSLVAVQIQVQKQARLLFRKYPTQKSVVLVACCANFWTYSILRADSELGASNVQEPPETDEAEIEMDPAFDPALDTNEFTSLIGPNTPGIGDYFEPVKTDNDMNAIVIDTDASRPWSKILKMETDASNQALYLIHKRLTTIALNPVNAVHSMG